MSAPPSPKAIGGYFELELRQGSGEFYASALRYQSARAAFSALLQHVRPDVLWMPWYNCETMLEAADQARVAVRRYGLDGDLYPKDVTLRAGHCILYVNYFGVCGRQVARLFDDFPRDRVILDQSQAFFAPAPDCLGTLYSPRKFFGVPDGGYLLTRVKVQPPSERDTLSLDRIRPLLIRFSEGPEVGYEAIKTARLSLKGQPPKTMSLLTEAMLRTVDYRSASRRRTENFTMLHGALGSGNRFPIPENVPEGPMCYPFLGELPGLHEWLIRQRVFVAHYWPGVRGPRGRSDDLEQMLTNECVPLPCDQRYDNGDMARVIRLVQGFVEHHGHR